MSTHRNTEEQQDEIRDRSNEQNGSVGFGPPTLKERIEAMKKENERLLHEFKSKERIYKFGLERFSSSSEDIKIYIGFNISEQVQCQI